MPGYFSKKKPNFSIYFTMKFRLITKLAVFLTFTAFISCSKDDSPSTTADYSAALTGSWRFVQGGANEKYLLFYENRTFSQLSAEPQANFHSRDDGVELATKDQIVLSFASTYGTSVYNYSISHDTLSLSGITDIYKLVETNIAPDTSEWIKTVQATYTISAPVNNPTDIAYDGTNLWYGNSGLSSYLYKVNPNNGSKDSILSGLQVQGIEFDGTNLWVNNDGFNTLSYIDITTGVEISKSSIIAPWIYSIARDDNFLWCYSNTNRTLYKYNTSLNTITTSIEISTSLRGMTFNNGFLYVTANGALHKCSFNPFTTELSFTLPGYTITGVTYDGASYWVSAYKTVSQKNVYKILKLSGVE